MPQLLIDKGSAARALSISVRQLSRFVAAGQLHPVRLGPRLVRFTPAELEAFMRRRSQPRNLPEWPLIGRARRVRPPGSRK
jgi:predicted DNA-binding transcriptional regulator AlpA